MDLESVKFYVLQQEALKLCIPVDLNWTEEDIYEVEGIVLDKHLEFKRTADSLYNRLVYEECYGDAKIVRESMFMTSDWVYGAIRIYTKRLIWLQKGIICPPGTILFPPLKRHSISMEGQSEEEEEETSDEEDMDIIQDTVLALPLDLGREVPPERSSLGSVTSSHASSINCWEEHCPEEQPNPLLMMHSDSQASLATVPDVVPTLQSASHSYDGSQEAVPCRVQGAVPLQLQGFSEPVSCTAYPREPWVGITADEYHPTNVLQDEYLKPMPCVGWCLDKNHHPNVWLECVDVSHVVRPPEVFAADADWNPTIDGGLVRTPEIRQTDVQWISMVEGRTRPPEICSW